MEVAGKLEKANDTATLVTFKAGLVTISLHPGRGAEFNTVIKNRSIKEARAYLAECGDDQDKRLFESLLQVALGDPEQAAVIRRGSSTRMLKPIHDADGNVLVPARPQSEPPIYKKGNAWWLWRADSAGGSISLCDSCNSKDIALAIAREECPNLC